MKTKKKKLIFLSPAKGTFVKQDLAFLQEHFSVVRIPAQKKGIAQIFQQIGIFFKILSMRKDYDYLYLWFAGYHSFLPTLAAKIGGIRSIVIIGGNDAAKEKALNYGALRKPISRWCIKKTCDWADLILPVSQFTKNKLFLNLKKAYPSKTKVIYNATSNHFLDINPEQKRTNSVVCICNISSWNAARLKGVDFLMELAQAYPKADFHLIGIKDPLLKDLRQKVSDNLQVHAFMPQEELKTILNTAKVIAQFSRHEAFGLALIEGMLCECVPVGYNFGATAEIINAKVGFLIDDLKVDLAIPALEKAFQQQAQLGPLAKQLVLDNFPLALRKQQLLNTLESIE